MRKFLPKIVLRAVFCALAVSVLGVCAMEPLDLKTFLEDDAVQQIIYSERVSLMPGSEGTAGNRRITGLDPNKYYIVVEYDESGTFLSANGTQVVTQNGSRSTALNSIGRVTGRTITGLDNDRKYMVKSAAALPASTLTYTDSGAVGSKTAVVSSGATTLPKPSGTYSLDISGYVYNIVKFVNLSGTGTTVTPSGNDITLETAGTVTDYVFAQNYNTNVEFTGNFYVLKVTIQNSQDLQINITYVHVSEKTFTFSPASVTFSQASLATSPNVSISIIPTDFSDIKWYYNNGSIQSGNPLALDLSNAANIDMLVVGDHIITVTATYTDGKPYSGTFTLRVTP